MFWFEPFCLTCLKNVPQVHHFIRWHIVKTHMCPMIEPLFCNDFSKLHLLLGLQKSLSCTFLYFFFVFFVFFLCFFEYNYLFLWRFWPRDFPKLTSIWTLKFSVLSQSRQFVLSFRERILHSFTWGTNGKKEILYCDAAKKRSRWRISRS